MSGKLSEIKSSIQHLISSQKYEEAWVKIKKQLSKKPRDTYFLNEAARLFKREGKRADSRAYYEKALSIDPNDAAAWNSLGILNYEDKDFAEAEKCYRNALKSVKNYAACHNNLGVLLTQMDRYDDAIHHYQMAVTYQPDHLEARYGLAAAQAKVDQLDAAVENMEYLLKHSPNDLRAQTSLGMIKLQQANFAEGWSLYRGRYAKSNPHAFTVKPEINRPYWEGENLSNKKILVYTEQGFGDEIQFSRYIPRLKTEKGAAAVYFVCRPETATLFKLLPGIDGVIVKNEAADYPEFDTWSMLLDLPRYFCVGDSPFAELPPYFCSSINAPGKWQPVTENKFSVGVVWKGNPKHKNDSYRSLENLSQLAPLWSVAGIKWFSLQKGHGEEEAKNASLEQPITAMGHLFRDYTDTAAVISQLDLIITVDTSVAHLAGALNKACWVLIPSTGTDWRWTNRAPTNPWYPSMALYYAQRDGGWDDALQAIKRDLTALVASSRSLT